MLCCTLDVFIIQAYIYSPTLLPYHLSRLALYAYIGLFPSKRKLEECSASSLKIQRLFCIHVPFHETNFLALARMFLNIFSNQAFGVS